MMKNEKEKRMGKKGYEPEAKGSSEEEAIAMVCLFEKKKKE